MRSVNLVCGSSIPYPTSMTTGGEIGSRTVSEKSQGAAAAAPYPDKVDVIQAAVERMPQVELPLTHRFTPGMYIRTIFMPKGALVISKIHRTQHPFVVTKGRCVVWAACAEANTAGPGNEGRWVEINAGHIGVTMPGTRRIIYICEDTEWTTFHATDKTTPEEVEADIIEPHDFDREEALRLFKSSVGRWCPAAQTSFTASPLHRFNTLTLQRQNKIK